MDWKIDVEWLKEIDQRQGDISDPAPYMTGLDVKVMEQRRLDQEAAQRNGAPSGVQTAEEPDPAGEEPKTKAIAA